MTIDIECWLKEKEEEQIQQKWTLYTSTILTQLTQSVSIIIKFKFVKHFKNTSEVTFYFGFIFNPSDNIFFTFKKLCGTLFVR